MSKTFEIETRHSLPSGGYEIVFKDEVDVNYYPLIRLMRDFGFTHQGGQAFLKRSGITFARLSELLQHLRFL
jgi:hypothetical protein